jgi:hypothetical protein
MNSASSTEIARIPTGTAGTPSSWTRRITLAWDQGVPS